jgi:DNA-binding XRE family transcriptional regulator
MPSHPNRSKNAASPAASPAPAKVRAAREAAGLTQTEAAEKIYGTLRAWQAWEAEADEEQHRRMHPGLFKLFMIVTGQDPEYQQKEKSCS